MSLAQVIGVDHDKCVNCHTCISVCPVKYCIDGSGDSVDINHDLCIGCGNCIDACSHDSRIFIDDFHLFQEALNQGEKIIAIVAPAVAASFPDHYLNLNGYLASLGISALFDVSFGAELTIQSYLNHIRENKPPMVIAQPCPALVTYIELYKPELLPLLAPADSPMVHTMKMIREYYKEYSEYKIAVISPCLAKKREFEHTGIGDFNVTIKSLQIYLKEKNITLRDYPAREFDNPSAERAVLFSSPGGLMRTALREVPGLLPDIRKTEGVPGVYEYLENLYEAFQKKQTPLLIDCLNCEKGCNGGTGTNNRETSIDEIEYHVEKRRKHMQELYKSQKGDSSSLKKISQVINRYWKPELYVRTYKDRSSANTLKIPEDQELRAIYEQMNKFSEKDHYNCSSCGYKRCEYMAIAIANGLNKPDNCHFYTISVMNNEKENLNTLSENLHSRIETSHNIIAVISGILSRLSQSCTVHTEKILASSRTIEHVMKSINSIANISGNKKRDVERLIETAGTASSQVKEMVKSIKGISDSVQSVGGMVNEITDIAETTNVLSINASIEAAHAGTSGNGFTVVAQEIKKLAHKAGENAGEITRNLDDISHQTRDSTDQSRETGKKINEMIERITPVVSSLETIVQSLAEMSRDSGDITTSLSSFKNFTQELSASFKEIQDSVENIDECISSMLDLSRESLKAFKNELNL